ncbi:MAG: hypothetical protein ASARMPREDX12_008310 [Alectoria sarmentosa]|nr:MAG: hypothetical protein ASARMPREDX12_008310 [Alectoria sarmentosa]
MSFELSEIRQESDFLELLQVLFVAYEDPFNPVRPLFYPILGHGPEARDTAIRESAERVFQRHKQNPSGRWVKVTDSSTGRFVGAALWMFFDKDPYTAQSLPECAWWPEGEGREFANLWSWGIRGPRVRYMSKPHAYLNVCFVHPDFRRRRVGTLLLKWGLDMADGMGLEVFIDSSDHGKGLYERHDFVAAPCVIVDFNKDNPGGLWKSLQQQCLPFRFWPMWRPVKGDYRGEKAFEPATLETF